MRRVEGFNGSTLVLDCGNRFADTIHFLCWQFVHGRAFLIYKSLCVPQLLLHDNLDIVIQRKHPEDFQRLCIIVLQQGWTATSTAIRCCPFRTEAQADEQDWTSHQCKSKVIIIRTCCISSWSQDTKAAKSGLCHGSTGWGECAAWPCERRRETGWWS